MHNFTITELIDGLKNRVFSSTEITQHFLSRIKTLDPAFNSVITLTEDQAIEAARLADQQMAKGDSAATLRHPCVAQGYLLH
jgi:aspartyl-tRNA(Asn)/glutamyl-tRNA(Gln) amidotransferase subunit A